MRLLPPPPDEEKSSFYKENARNSSSVSTAHPPISVVSTEERGEAIESVCSFRPRLRAERRPPQPQTGPSGPLFFVLVARLFVVQFWLQVWLCCFGFFLVLVRLLEEPRLLVHSLTMVYKFDEKLLEFHSVL
jgi:hypothetical protein